MPSASTVMRCRIDVYGQGEGNKGRCRPREAQEKRSWLPSCLVTWALIGLNCSRASIVLTRASIVLTRALNVLAHLSRFGIPEDGS